MESLAFSVLWTDWQVNILAEYKIQQIFNYGWQEYLACASLLRMFPVHTVFSGLPLEGLRNMPNFICKCIFQLVFGTLSDNFLIFSHSGKILSPYTFFAKGPRIGTIEKNHIQSSSCFIQNCSFCLLKI